MGRDALPATGTVTVEVTFANPDCNAVFSPVNSAFVVGTAPDDTQYTYEDVSPDSSTVSDACSDVMAGERCDYTGAINEGSTATYTYTVDMAEAPGSLNDAESAVIGMRYYGEERPYAYMTVPMADGGNGASPDDETTVSLDLHGGWNMISIPAFTVGNHLNAANITGDCTFVATSNDKLGYHYPSEDGNYLQTDTVESSRGYWVKTEAECTANFTTDALIGNDISEISLAAGWNMVSVQTATTFNNINGDCTLADTTIYHWNGNTYQQLTTSDTLNPKKAYWINTQNSCTLDTLDDVPEPPS